MQQTTKTEIADRWHKLARLAFDRAAAPGESQAAFIKMQEHLKKHNLFYDDLRPFKRKNVTSQKREFWPPFSAMPDGKYVGIPFEKIYQFDRSYLGDILMSADATPRLKNAILDFLKTKINADHSST